MVENAAPVELLACRQPTHTLAWYQSQMPVRVKETGYSADADDVPKEVPAVLAPTAENALARGPRTRRSSRATMSNRAVWVAMGAVRAISRPESGEAQLSSRETRNGIKSASLDAKKNPCHRCAVVMGSRTSSESAEPYEVG